ncbi:hypothetical protein [uncultured Winogradskyella sp.]|uniref:hypothetical protein n=1 Tax=uncultured Winogradskyella sp. TaxID=395353 RepID=UPI00261EE201|nr:hypothetical protein [uncultured Winogradskyella sp.]
MNKYFYLLAFLCLYITAHAQTTSLNVSESIEFKDKVKAGGALAIHTTEDGKTGIIRQSKKNILFDVFDNELNKTFSTQIESNKKEVYKSNVTYKDEIKIFTLFSPKKKERIIYCHTFNIKTKKHSKKQLLSKTIDKKFPLFSGGMKRETSFSISPNGLYIAMATDDVKKNSNSYTIHVFDTETLELVYKKSYSRSENKFFEFNDLVVTDNATAYSLGKLYKTGKSEKNKGDANYQFVIYKISNDNVSSNLISLENEHISSLNIIQNNEGLQLIGFYSEKNSGQIKGGCSFNLSQDNLNVIDKKSFELPQQVFQDLYRDKKAKRKKKKGKEFSNFYTDYIIEDAIGNTYLVAEEFFVTQTYVSNGMNGGGYWQTVYHYNDILILKFNNTGELDWGRSIFKNSNIPSYNVFLKDEKLHVILNSGKNLTEKKDGRTKVSKGWFESSSLYDIVFNIDGEVKYDKIQDNKGKTYYLPYFGTYNDGTFIMMSDRRKRKQFMKLQ